MTNQADYWSDKPARFVQKNAFADKCGVFLSGTEKLLDLGCGHGEDSLHFAKLGCDATAIDISAVNIAHLKENPEAEKIKAIQHDLADPLPFDDKLFDAVYAHLSLHYFDDAKTKEIFEEILRVLKPGGWLFAKCKSVDDPLYGKGELIAKDMYKQEHVRHFFSAEYMRECLAKFDIQSIEKTSSKYIDYESAFIEAIARKSII
jgi:SAM-dependent methyltransferase